jgi:hypothetical protein
MHERGFSAATSGLHGSRARRDLHSCRIAPSWRLAQRPATRAESSHLGRALFRPPGLPAARYWFGDASIVRIAGAGRALRHERDRQVAGLADGPSCRPPRL